MCGQQQQHRIKASALLYLVFDIGKHSCRSQFFCHHQINTHHQWGARRNLSLRDTERERTGWWRVEAANSSSRKRGDTERGNAIRRIININLPRSKRMLLFLDIMVSRSRAARYVVLSVVGRRESLALLCFFLLLYNFRHFCPVAYRHSSELCNDNTRMSKNDGNFFGQS